MGAGFRSGCRVSASFQLARFVHLACSMPLFLLIILYHPCAFPLRYRILYVTISYKLMNQKVNSNQKEFPMIGFSGSRRLRLSHRPVVESMVSQVVAQRHQPVVGCANGLDEMVRQAPAFESAGRVFVAQSRQPRELVARSVRMVVSLYGAPGAAILCWPQGCCPSGLRPSSSSGKCFCGLGSGTWASAALAVGLGVQVFVFGESARYLPASWGLWSASKRFPHCHVLAPACGQQLALF